jgi:hypothetical protein
MIGIPSDEAFVEAFVAQAKPNCSGDLTSAWDPNPLRRQLDLEPFDDQELERIRESQLLICHAPPGTLKGPRNGEPAVVACNECGYGWGLPARGGAGEDAAGPLTCLPSTACDAQPPGGCQTCELDSTHWMVRVPCDVCIEVDCVNGRCSCRW